jgi:hypothetical protein
MEMGTALNITSGSNTPNIDFKLLKLLGGTVGGRVNGTSRDPQLKATLLGGKLEELLDTPIAADGTFEFGHLPSGTYLVGLFPRPAGFSSLVVPVGDKDVSGLMLTLPPTRAVSGRIVIENGPLPHSLLAFSTNNSYVSASISPDLTFTTRLHAARHRVDLAGMPVGYTVTSVKIGTQDATEGFVVGNADISGMTISVSAPHRLPKIHGTVTGLSAEQIATAKIELAGPIVGTLQAPVQKDGSFDFATVIPGLYRLRIPQVQALAPMEVTVAGWDTTQVRVAVPGR